MQFPYLTTSGTLLLHTPLQGTIFAPLSPQLLNPQTIKLLKLSTINSPLGACDASLCEELLTINY